MTSETSQKTTLVRPPLQGLGCIEVPEARGRTRTQVSIEEVSKSERKIGL
jgi:hypothetical protein